MPLPSNTTYGKVTGRYVLAVADGVDVDSTPDSTPAVGTATFTASTSRLLDVSSTPPATIVPLPVVCTFDGSGNLLDPQGNAGVWLIATDNAGINPQGWTWKVTLSFTGLATPINFSFELPGGETVDLTQVTPVPSANGTFRLVGPPGPQGPAGDPDLILPILDERDAELLEQIGALIVGGGTELVGTTVDTDSDYRLIMFGSGYVRGIPIYTPLPVPPTDLAITPRLSSVRLTWTAAETIPGLYLTYRIFKNGVQVATTDQVSWRDRNISAGSTYTYALQTVDAYGQVSDITEEVEAFIDPALNEAPVVSISAYPAVAPTDGITILRVIASDQDAQTLILNLVPGAGTGTLTATDDPSVWHYTP